MKKNGFTLVELLGIIVIISLTLLIVVPQVISTFSNSSSKEVETYKHDIEEAAQSYVETNWNLIKASVITNPCIPVSTLIEHGYLSNTMVDPYTDHPINPENKFVFLERESGTEKYRFEYFYVDIADTNETRCK